MFEDHLTAYWHGVRLPSTNKATMISTSPGISSIYIYIYIATQQFPFILQPTAQPTAGPLLDPGQAGDV